MICTIRKFRETILIGKVQHAPNDIEKEQENAKRDHKVFGACKANGCVGKLEIVVGFQNGKVCRDHNKWHNRRDADHFDKRDDNRKNKKQSNLPLVPFGEQKREFLEHATRQQIDSKWAILTCFK